MKCDHCPCRNVCWEHPYWCKVAAANPGSLALAAQLCRFDEIDESATFERLEAQRIAYEAIPPEERRRCCGQ